MIDETSLFLHVLAAVGMIGGGITQVMAGHRLRAADAASEIASWARFARAAGWLIAASAGVLLLTGGHLAGAVWTTEQTSGFSFPFITLGMIGLVLLAPVGPMLGGARLRRVAERADEAPDGRASDELRAAACAPSLWGPVHSLPGVGVGFVALMTYKPGWLAGAAILVITFALGWLAGVAVSTDASGTARPARPPRPLR